VLVSLVLGLQCIFSRSSTYPYIESSPGILLFDIGRGLEEVMHKHPQQGKFVLVSLVLGSQCISSGSRTYPYIESSPRILLSDVGHVSEEVRLKHPQQGKFVLISLVLGSQFTFYVYIFLCQKQSCNFPL